MMISNENEIFDIISDRIDSKDYWVFITDATDLLITIEHKYYKPKTPANADFEIALLTPEFIKIATAHKKRMSFEQLKSLMFPYMDQRSRDQVTKRHITDDIDVFMIPNLEQTRRVITEVMFRLQNHIMTREVDRYGLDETIGTECQYHYTMLAEQEQEQDIRCKEKPTRVISGFTKGHPSERLTSASLCENHFDRVNKWINKQPDIY